MSYRWRQPCRIHRLPRGDTWNVLRCYKGGVSGTMRPAIPYWGSRCIMTRAAMIVVRTASIRSATPWGETVVPLQPVDLRSGDMILVLAYMPPDRNDIS